MGRAGSGVEVRAKSIRFTFVPGKPTLMVNGQPAAPTPANVKWAHRLAAEIRERIRHGTFSMAEYFPATGTAGTLTTVASQLDTWLAAQRIASSTRKTYESAARFWKDAPVNEAGDPMGLTSLRSLRHSHVLTALASRPLLTGKTVNNYVSVLRDAVALAIEDKILVSNPVAAVPHASHQKAPPDPFSADEVELILADMAAHYDPREVDYCEFKFFTGLRPSEAIALRWPNVDLVKGELLICEAVVLGDRKDTKTNVARVVKLNSRAKAALLRQRAHTYLAGGAVFYDPLHGEAWADERNFKKRCWAPCLKRLGLRYRPPYNTRHTYATLLLMRGVKTAFAAKQMGHSRQVFDSTYARWIDGDSDDLEMAKLESSPDLPRDGGGRVDSPM